MARVLALGEGEVLAWSDGDGAPLGTLAVQLAAPTPSTVPGTVQERTGTLCDVVGCGTDAPRRGRAVDTFRLVSRATAFDGVRWWFQCLGCGRCTATLYRPTEGALASGGRWWCRRCYRLTYPVQRETPEQRAARQLAKVSARLACSRTPEDLEDTDPAEWVPDRPKGMRRRRYTRTVAQWGRALEAYSEESARAWDRMAHGLDRVIQRIERRRRSE